MNRLTDSPRTWFFLSLALHGLITAPSALGDDKVAVQRARIGQTVRLAAPREKAGDSRAFVQLDYALGELPQVQLRELRATGDLVVPSQIEASAPPRLWWIVRGDSAEATPRRYRLERGPASVGTRLAIERDEVVTTVKLGQTPVLQYNAAHRAAPEGVDPRYGRSAFIHPAWTPNGRIVTDQFPPDHLHQSGIFLAYTKTRFEGREPNFWELANGKGRVRFQRYGDSRVGPVFAEFQAVHEHLDETAQPPKVALRESWNIRVWDLGSPAAGYFAWDVESRSECATTSPLELPQYHYGGMALRGARAWGGDRALFRTSEAKGRLDGNHSRPRWCDLSGELDGHTAGLALFTHPGNFRYPEPLRIHPSMPYMVYTPSQLGDWSIAPGQVHRSQYRFVTHDGALASTLADALAEDLAKPTEAQPE